MYSNFKAKKMLKVKSKRKSMRYKMLYLSQIKISTLKQKKLSSLLLLLLYIYYLFYICESKIQLVNLKRKRKTKGFPHYQRESSSTNLYTSKGNFYLFLSPRLIEQQYSAFVQTEYTYNLTLITIYTSFIYSRKCICNLYIYTYIIQGEFKNRIYM